MTLFRTVGLDSKGRGLILEEAEGQENCSVSTGCAVFAAPALRRHYE